MQPTTTQEVREDRSMIWAAVAVAAIVILVAAFLVSQNNRTTVNNVTPPAVNNPVNPPTTTPPQNDDIQEFDLEEQNSSDQNGTVRLEEVDGQVKVTISLSNPNDTPQPAHIHLGSCPLPGAVQFELNEVLDGSSVTTINTTMATLVGLGNLSVNIHKSDTESDVYVSCGNLDF